MVALCYLETLKNLMFHYWSPTDKMPWSIEYSCEEGGKEWDNVALPPVVFLLMQEALATEDVQVAKILDYKHKNPTQ